MRANDGKAFVILAQRAEKAFQMQTVHSPEKNISLRIVAEDVYV
jgi:hypothetical protein